jgi:hypothetical protein
MISSHCSSSAAETGRTDIDAPPDADNKDIEDGVLIASEESNAERPAAIENAPTIIQNVSLVQTIDSCISTHHTKN